MVCPKQLSYNLNTYILMSYSSAHSAACPSNSTTQATAKASKRMRACRKGLPIRQVSCKMHQALRSEYLRSRWYRTQLQALLPPRSRLNTLPRNPARTITMQLFSGRRRMEITLSWGSMASTNSESRTVNYGCLIPRKCQR